MHKSDVGGVRLHVLGAQAIEEETASPLAHIKTACPAADIEGVLVAPMAAKGAKVILGVITDPQFGIMPIVASAI